MDQFNNGRSGVDLADASDVDRAFAALQDRVERAERLLAAGALEGRDMSAAAAPAPIDMASAGRVAGMFRQATPALRSAVLSKRRQQVGEVQLRRELSAIATAGDAEYRVRGHDSFRRTRGDRRLLGHVHASGGAEIGVPDFRKPGVVRSRLCAVVFAPP